MEYFKLLVLGTLGTVIFKGYIEMKKHIIVLQSELNRMEQKMDKVDEKMDKMGEFLVLVSKRLDELDTDLDIDY